MAKHTVSAPETVHNMNLDRARIPQGPWIIPVSMVPNPNRESGCVREVQFARPWLRGSCCLLVMMMIKMIMMGLKKDKRDPNFGAMENEWKAKVRSCRELRSKERL